MIFGTHDAFVNSHCTTSPFFSSTESAPIMNPNLSSTVLLLLLQCSVKQSDYFMLYSQVVFEAGVGKDFQSDIAVDTIHFQDNSGINFFDKS